MNWTSAFQLAVAIIASLGGGGAIVFGLSSYLGKLWADRALEQEKHKYADMLQESKSELDKAASQYQVRLNALGHIHQLRTNEEFSRLGQLWKHMAILKDAFNNSCSLGLRLEPADIALREKFRIANRKVYEDALFQTRKFFLEEKLFVPAKVADCAEATLRFALHENNFHALFADDPVPTTSRMYTQELEGWLNGFDRGMVGLEELMREHIEGRRLDSPKTWNEK